MKYCTLWKKQIQTLPYKLQTQCLNYKEWKKINNIDQTIYNKIDDACKNIDKIFTNYKLQKNVLYQFAVINKQTLYKLSKRLAKKTEFNVLEWYNNNKIKYNFCGGYKLKRIDLEIHGFEECPICLEIQNTMIISDCGHVLCINCFKQLYHIDNLNGKLFNLISYSIYYNHVIPKCPICRQSMPIHLKDDQIISKKHYDLSSFLSKFYLK